MEFNEKLQLLRKQQDLTQEQLAGQLYVSRTAISKWESGKGYPNIESLKAISKTFSVSIDELLSGEEIITYVESEQLTGKAQNCRLLFGILDLLTVAFLILPLYGQDDGEMIRLVPLLAYTESSIIRTVYFVISGFMILLGVTGLKRWKKAGVCSVAVHILAIFLFIMTRQPYATAFSFMLFLLKMIVVRQLDISLKNGH